MARLASSLMLFVLPAAAASDTLGYAQATGYYKRDSQPTQYLPLNLLDGKASTAWCSPSGDPLNEQLSFGFKVPITLDAVRIVTGNGASDEAFAEFSRPRKLSLRGPTSGQLITLADQKGEQIVELKPPLSGTRFTIEILDLFPAEDPDQPACISDIVFLSEGKAQNGPWLAPRLRYDKAQAQLLGTWFAGYPGAPDRFLSFFFDGTFRYSYEPFERPEEAKALEGSYDVHGARLTLELPGGKGKASAQFKLERATSGASLSIRGELPPELRQRFRDSL